MSTIDPIETIRDKIAITILPAIYTEYVREAEKTGYKYDWQTGLSMDAYSLADAMIKAREL